MSHESYIARRARELADCEIMLAVIQDIKNGLTDEKIINRMTAEGETREHASSIVGAVRPRTDEIEEMIVITRQQWAEHDESLMQDAKNRANNAHILSHQAQHTATHLSMEFLKKLLGG